MTCVCNGKFTPQGWFDDIQGVVTGVSSNLISGGGVVLGNISDSFAGIFSPVAAQIIDVPDTSTKLVQDIQWVGIMTPDNLTGLERLQDQLISFNRISPGIFDVNVQPMGDVCDDGFAEDAGQCKACLFGLGLSGKWALTREETQSMRACVQNRGLAAGVTNNIISPVSIQSNIHPIFLNSQSLMGIFNI